MTVETPRRALRDPRRPAICTRQTTSAARRAAVAHVVHVMRGKLTEHLSLEDLAREAFLSPYHFHRVFKEVTGLTPREYAAAHREKRVRSRLARGASVTEALFDAGYNSSARFYEKAGEALGMAPARFRALFHRSDYFVVRGENHFPQIAEGERVAALIARWRAGAT